MLLAALLIAGFTGLLGGHAPASHRTQSGGVVLGVTTPATLRNGMMFETLIEVEAKRPVEELVVGISHSLWREMTINTMIPAAEKEEYKEGFHRFSFASLKPGEVFRFKIDGQINPPLLDGVRGEIVAYDGKEKLAGVVIRTRVLP